MHVYETIVISLFCAVSSLQVLSMWMQKTNDSFDEKNFMRNREKHFSRLDKEYLWCNISYYLCCFGCGCKAWKFKLCFSHKSVRIIPLLPMLPLCSQINNRNDVVFDERLEKDTFSITYNVYSYFVLFLLCKY